MSRSIGMSTSSGRAESHVWTASKEGDPLSWVRRMNVRPVAGSEMLMISKTDVTQTQPHLAIGGQRALCGGLLCLEPEHPCTPLLVPQCCRTHALPHARNTLFVAPAATGTAMSSKYLSIAITAAKAKGNVFKKKSIFKKAHKVTPEGAEKKGSISHIIPQSERGAGAVSFDLWTGLCMMPEEPVPLTDYGSSGNGGRARLGGDLRTHSAVRTRVHGRMAHVRGCHLSRHTPSSYAVVMRHAHSPSSSARGRAAEAGVHQAEHPEGGA